MNTKTQWVVGTLVLCLLILVGGWFGLVSPQKTKAKSYNAQTAAQLVDQQEARGQLAVLTSEARHIAAQQAKLAKAQTYIPLSPALPTLIRQMTALTTEAGVDISTISPATPTEVTSTSADTSTTPSSTTSAAPAAGALYSVPIDMTVVGGYFQMESFFADLEQLPRAFQTISIDVTPSNPSAGQGTGTDSSSPVGTAISADASQPGAITVSLSGRVFMTTTNLTASAAS